MRNLLALLAVAALSVVGLGWYLDWFRFQSTPSSPGHRSITVDIDSEKIGEDLKKGAERGAARLHESLDKKRGERPVSPSSGDEPKDTGFPPPPPETDAAGPSLP